MYCNIDRVYRMVSVKNEQKSVLLEMFGMILYDPILLEARTERRAESSSQAFGSLSERPVISLSFVIGS